MSPSRRFAVASVLAALCIAAAAPAQADLSHKNRFDSFHFRVGCGVQLASAGGGMSCFSLALPETELDGYVELHATGSPTLGERGDSPWRHGNPIHLRKGDSWSRADVTCERRAVLRCTNQDGHGFTLTPKAYALF
jgi:hypothetical protein